MLQWYLTAKPALRLRRKKKIPATLDGRPVLIGHIPGNPTWLERVLFLLHLMFLLSGFGFLLAISSRLPRDWDIQHESVLSGEPLPFNVP